jgi:hypothetical protein
MNIRNGGKKKIKSERSSEKKGLEIILRQKNTLKNIRRRITKKKEKGKEEGKRKREGRRSKACEIKITNEQNKY